MIESGAERSFGTYGKGAASAPSVQAPGSSVVQRISPSMVPRFLFSPSSSAVAASIWTRADDRLCYTSFCAGLVRRADMRKAEQCVWIRAGGRLLLATAAASAAGPGPPPPPPPPAPPPPPPPSPL